MPSHIVARANLLALVALTGLLVLMGLVIWDRWNAARQARVLVQHTYEVLDTIRKLEIGLGDAETGQRGYLLTGDPDYLRPYEEALSRVTFIQGSLQRLTVDRPEAQERLRELGGLSQRRLALMAQGIQQRRDAGEVEPRLLERLGEGEAVMTELREHLAALTAEEQRLAAERLERAEADAVLLRGLAGAVVPVVTAALGLAAWMLNRALAHSRRNEAQHHALALRLRAMLDSISQGVAVFGPDRRLTHWNECFRILLDLPRAMVREGMPYAAFAEHEARKDPEGGPVGLESEDQLRRDPDMAGAVSYEHLSRAGHLLEVRRAPMPDGGFVLTLLDMTARSRAEGVLREAQKMQAIGQLTGGIAHDFNNLLMVILGNLEFARDRLEKSPERDDRMLTRLERAVWAAQRGASLTAQLLAFARKQPLAPQSIDLAASLPDMVPLLRRTLGETIDVRFVQADGLWPVMADAAQLESAVLNLALNARDAMPGGGRLTIETANKVLDADYAARHDEVAPGDYVMIAVSDTGHGMQPEVLARVFEPFFTTKPEGKGTGLGLAMVFGFVKQSRGHIKIYSRPGEGTVVKIYLPRAVAVAAVPAGPPAPSVLPRGEATVLLVEDEPAVREITVAMLRDLGYRVLEAADGEEGLRVFGAHAAAVDLLLTDVVLPGKVRGRELAERIQAIRPQVRVLFMSGYTENAAVHQGRPDEGVQLLGKPFQRETLARRVAEILGRSPPAASQPVSPPTAAPVPLPVEAPVGAGASRASPQEPGRNG